MIAGKDDLTKHSGYCGTTGHNNDGPCLIHAECEKEDNVFPMIPAGAAISEMLTEAPKHKLAQPKGST